MNTGGGDAPGLNAVIRSVVLSALNQGWEVFGIEHGYEGLFTASGVVRMDRESVQGIAHLRGTILGTTNRGNPLAWPRALPDGSVEIVDRSEDVLEAFRGAGLDALVAIGGDGSLRIAADLSRRGLPVVGVPKTIDNDLAPPPRARSASTRPSRWRPTRSTSSTRQRDPTSGSWPSS